MKQKTATALPEQATHQQDTLESRRATGVGLGNKRGGGGADGGEGVVGGGEHGERTGAGEGAGEAGGDDRGLEGAQRGRGDDEVRDGDKTCLVGVSDCCTSLNRQLSEMLSA